MRKPAAPCFLRGRHPPVQVVGQEHFERLAHQSGERRRLAVGRHRDRHPGLLDDRSRISARALQVVHGVDEEAPRLGRARDRTIHLRRRRGDDIPDAIDIAGFERPAHDGNLRRQDRNLIDDVRRDDRDPRASVDKRAHLPRRHRSGPDHEDGPPFELEEHGKYRHPDSASRR